MDKFGRFQEIIDGRLGRFWAVFGGCKILYVSGCGRFGRLQKVSDGRVRFVKTTAHEPSPYNCNHQTPQLHINEQKKTLQKLLTREISKCFAFKNSLKIKIKNENPRLLAAYHLQATVRQLQRLLEELCGVGAVGDREPQVAQLAEPPGGSGGKGCWVVGLEWFGMVCLGVKETKRFHQFYQHT